MQISRYWVGLILGWALAVSGPLSAADRRPALERTTDKTTAATAKIDINTASHEQLESLPGVGPEIADAIIAARPFRAVSELENVKGIGPVRMGDLRNRVTASTPSPRATRPATTNRAATSDRATGTKEPATTSRSRVEDRTSSSVVPTHRVNINTATREELEALPEIGPVKAQAIINARPFAKPEDVMRVSGIKEATFEAIREHITVR